MSRMLDAFTPRPMPDGKTFWHKVGRAWEADNGNITIYLDSVPAPTMNPRIEGAMQYQIHLFEPKPKEEEKSAATRETLSDAKKRGSGKAGGKSKSISEELDDEIPF